jgi:hypothetical protein
MLVMHDEDRQEGRIRECPEPEFVNILRSPGIDSKSIPSLAESIHWNRFQGSLNVYKYGLRNTGLNILSKGLHFYQLKLAFSFV